MAKKTGNRIDKEKLEAIVSEDSEVSEELMMQLIEEDAKIEKKYEDTQKTLKEAAKEFVGIAKRMQKQNMKSKNLIESIKFGVRNIREEERWKDKAVAV